MGVAICRLIMKRDLVGCLFILLRGKEVLKDQIEFLRELIFKIGVFRGILPLGTVK
jgi:hypothetical protein